MYVHKIFIVIYHHAQIWSQGNNSTYVKNQRRKVLSVGWQREAAVNSPVKH